MRKRLWALSHLYRAVRHGGMRFAANGTENSYHNSGSKVAHPVTSAKVTLSDWTIGATSGPMGPSSGQMAVCAFPPIHVFCPQAQVPAGPARGKASGQSAWWAGAWPALKRPELDSRALPSVVLAAIGMFPPPLLPPGRNSALRFPSTGWSCHHPAPCPVDCRLFLPSAGSTGQISRPPLHDNERALYNCADSGSLPSFLLTVRNPRSRCIGLPLQRPPIIPDFFRNGSQPRLRNTSREQLLHPFSHDFTFFPHSIPPLHVSAISSAS